MPGADDHADGRPRLKGHRRAAEGARRGLTGSGPSELDRSSAAPASSAATAGRGLSHRPPPREQVLPRRRLTKRRAHPILRTPPHVSTDPVRHAATGPKPRGLFAPARDVPGGARTSSLAPDPPAREGQPVPTITKGCAFGFVMPVAHVSAPGRTHPGASAQTASRLAASGWPQ